MIFDNYTTEVRDTATYNAHMTSYKEIYDSIFASQWRQEDKYGNGVECKRVLAYNAWLIFKLVLQDDIELFNVINPAIPEDQIKERNLYNDALNCFRCSAIEVDNKIDMSAPPMSIYEKPYYFGTTGTDTITVAQIQSLLTVGSAMALPVETTGYVTSQGYIYFVYPTEWGELTEVIQSAFNTIHEFDTSLDIVTIPTLSGNTSYTVVKSLDLHEIIGDLTITYKA